MKTLRQLAAVALVAVLLHLGQVLPATVGMTPELQADLAVIAARKGISIEEAQRRHNLRQTATPVIEAVAGDPHQFADAFQDDSDGTWRLRILYVGDGTAARARVASTIPKGMPVEWEQVSLNYDQLHTIRGEVIDLWIRLGLDRLTSVSIRGDLNKVVVSMPRPDPSLADELRQRYGNAVSLEIEPPDDPAACNAVNDPEGGSRYNCTPMRGGIEIQMAPNTRGCTTMMWAKHQNNASLKYLITAGHCPTNDLGPHDFFHNNQLVGRSNRNSWTLASPRSDSKRIPATGNATQMNRIYETPTTKSYAITAIVGWENQRLNDWVCKHGVGPAFFGRSCGQIVNADTTWTWNGKITPAKQADFNGSNAGWGVDNGDSGGPVAYSGKIYGLLASTHGRYSVAIDVQTDMLVRLCLNADCTAP